MLRNITKQYKFCIKNYITIQNISIALIFFGAIFLRFFRMSDFIMFLSDQGRDAIIIKRIVTLEHWPAIGATTSLGGVFLGPFYYYLVAPFLVLFNFDPVGLAFGVGFYSILAIFFIYRTTFSHFDKNISILFIFFIAFSHVLISQARFSWNPNLLPYFSFFSLYFFYKSLTPIQSNYFIYSVLSGIFLGLAIQLHYLALILLTPMIIFYIRFLIVDKQKINIIKNAVSMFTAFIVVNLPLIIFDIRHKFINISNLFKLLTKDKLINNTPYIDKLNSNLSAFIKYSIGYTKMNNFNYYTILAILIMIGVYLIISRKINLFLKINYINIISYIFIFSMISSPSHLHYYNSIYLSFYFILSYLIIIAVNTFNYKTRYLIISIFIISFLVINVSRYSYLSGEKQNQVEQAKKVANFLAKKINNQPFNIATWPISFFEDQYLYFLELKNLIPADRAKNEITNQMFILCVQEPCQVIDSPSWNINMFGKARIAKIWKVDNLIIYKLLHE